MLLDDKTVIGAGPADKLTHCLDDSICICVIFRTNSKLACTVECARAGEAINATIMSDLNLSGTDPSPRVMKTPGPVQ